MRINYKATGSERKRLVNAISQITFMKAKYLGMPTMAYEIGNITVDKNGSLFCADDARAEYVAENLIDYCFTLADSIEDKSSEQAAEEAFAANDSDSIDNIKISLPKEGFTDEALSNLNHLVESKATLIKKALGVDDRTIIVDDEQVTFPWFARTSSTNELSSYASFIGKLCCMAKTQKRVTAKEKEVDNEKYAFRCFLLRLGFIGAEYKTDRRILLKNLSGSSAFKGGASNDDE